MLSPQNSEPIELSQVARLPSPRDNCALACASIPAGTQLVAEDGTLITLKESILEGHRFPLATALEGTLLTSWDLPFGRALRDIEPGEALYNRTALKALSVRFPDRDFPSDPNFENHTAVFHWDRDTYQSAPEPQRMERPGSFMGFDRGADRGSGTRNFLVVLGTNSLSAPLVQRLVETLRPSIQPTAGFDGVVPVTHTEGGGDTEPNNAELILRALAGWVVHPNVGAVVAIDAPQQPIDNHRLRGFLKSEGYPEEPSRLAYYSLTGDTDTDIAKASALARSFVTELSGQNRTPRPMEHLKIALQCGGSDAFSGLSGNPLAGWVAKELIAHGGSANLAETSELIGAESYVLAKTKSASVVERFLWIRDRFQQWAAWHGHSAEGNPSGGNIIRGLYNITIKSIGAANKKHPDTRLDAVLEYGEPMAEPGYYFMDSPGNDLESIAGQVASGCNLILFITGNGSITNFPFVPTLKFVTTTDRYRLLSKEMDVNAGRYQDGESMEALGSETFELVQRVASGERTCGERAGHSQVQIWRDWRQSDDTALPSFANPPTPSGVGLQCLGIASNDGTIEAAKALREAAQQRIRLIAPASLCSGQIARIAADQLNQSNKDSTVRYLALDHTEGCGVARGPSEDLFVRVMLHYALHPLVESCLFLEHGCEKTHNGEFRQALLELGERPEAFGWASVQLDGGATKVTERIGEWFQTAPIRGVRHQHPAIAFLGHSKNGQGNPKSFATIVAALLAAGISPLFGHRDAGLSQIADWIDGDIAVPTLAHGEAPQTLGIHIMDMPTTRYEEQLTGLCAGGAMAVVRATESPASWNNPLVPHIDWRFQDSIEETLRMWADQLGAHNQAQEPRSLQTFQITRAERGFSL